MLKVKTGVHFAHEEQLHDDDDYDDDDDDSSVNRRVLAHDDGGAASDDDDDDEQVRSVATPSECSSASGDEPVLFFSDEWEDGGVQDRSPAAEPLLSPVTAPAAPGPLTPVDDEEEAEAAAASKENVLQNIFTSLSCRSETPTDRGDVERTRKPPPPPAVKHVRLRDRMEPVEREADYS